MISWPEEKPSCWSPYTLEALMTVWIPSLKNRYAARNASVCG